MSREGAEAQSEKAAHGSARGVSAGRSSGRPAGGGPSPAIGGEGSEGGGGGGWGRLQQSARSSRPSPLGGRARDHARVSVRAAWECEKAGVLLLHVYPPRPEQEGNTSAVINRLNLACLRHRSIKAGLVTSGMFQISAAQSENINCVVKEKC